MKRSLATVGLTIAVVGIITSLTTCASTSQQHEADLELLTPSSTWLLSVTSLEATPVSTQASNTYDKVSKQPTPTPHPETVKRGQRLFYQLGCFYCHGIRAEGAVGPQLARTRLSLDLVIQQVYQPVGDMPPFSPATASESDLAAVYAFLQNLKPIGPHPEITTSRSDTATGEALYRFFGCFGCHGYQGEGGYGPRLAGIQLSLEKLRAQVREPRDRMPAFGPKRISNEELTHIYAFLQSLPSAGETD